MPILPRRIDDNNDSIKYPITGMNYNVDMWKRNGESIEKEEEEEKRTFTSHVERIISSFNNFFPSSLFDIRRLKELRR